MKTFILLLFCCSFILQYFSYSYANTGGIDLHTQLRTIGDALNHQNFTEAIVLKDEILKQTSVEEIAKNTNYNDFLIYLQLLMWN